MRSCFLAAWGCFAKWVSNLMLDWEWEGDGVQGYIENWEMVWDLICWRKVVRGIREVK